MSRLTPCVGTYPYGKVTNMLTHEEQKVVADLGQCWNNLCTIVGEGPTRDADLQEAVIHIHALQQFVMAQSAARYYPDQFRLLGETLNGAANG